MAELASTGERSSDQEAAGVPQEASPPTARVGSGILAWWGARAWWVQVVLLYAASRIFSFCVFSAAALHQGENPWFDAHPDYWRFLQIWDSAWYGRIVEEGYPTAIPRGPDGGAQENAWAFYALFPFLVRGLSSLSGLPWEAVAQVVALLAGFGAALFSYRLFRCFSGPSSSLWGVAFFAFFPVAAILQVPYAESLSMMLLAWALLWVVRGRYLSAIPVVALLALSRPVGVPFALMLGVLLLIRAAASLRGVTGAPTKGEIVRLLVLTVAAGASALAWPAIAWAVTGEQTAYTDTETVWRGGPLVPFLPWFDTGRLLFGPVLGLFAPILFAALAGWALCVTPVRRLGTELRLWCAAYLLYLLAFLHPQTSTFRMLLPLFPLALAAALLSRSRAYRGSVLVMFGLLQIVWVVWLWAWAPLPGGGDYPP